MEKRCPACGLVKDAAEFGRNKRTSDGLACYCKPCTSGLNRAQYLANQERRKVEARDYRAANVERLRQMERERWKRRRGQQSEYRKAHRDRIREANREWRRGNPGYHQRWRLEKSGRLEYERAWRDANRDLRNRQNRDRRASNPEPFIRAKNAYRARRVSAPRAPYSDSDLIAKFEYWGRRCWLCGTDLAPGFHWDHVKPLNKGGSDMLANLRPACGPCNQSKRDRWPFGQVEKSRSQSQPATSSAPPE